MAKRRVDTAEDDIVKRNIELQAALMRYILQQPDVLDQLPGDFRLVILPENDPELRAYNLDLLDKHPPHEKPVVFVRMAVGEQIDFGRQRPTLYLPLAA